MKKKLITIGVIVFVSLLITYFNISSTFKIVKEDNLIIEEVEKKYSNFANQFVDTYFPIFNVKNIIDQSYDSTFFKDGFLILLSNSACNPCQVSELKNLNNLYKKYSDRKIMALYVSNYERNEALRLKKVSSYSLPIYVQEEIEISDKFLMKPFPKVFYIDNQKILSALIPIPNNNKLSEKFYEELENHFELKQL